MLEKKFQILLQIMQRTWMYLIHKVFVFSEKVPFITTVVMKTLSENRTFLQIFQSAFYYCKNYQLVITNSSPYQQPKLLKKKTIFYYYKNIPSSVETIISNNKGCKKQKDIENPCFFMQTLVQCTKEISSFPWTISSLNKRFEPSHFP